MVVNWLVLFGCTKFINFFYKFTMEKLAFHDSLMGLKRAFLIKNMMMCNLYIMKHHLKFLGKKKAKETEDEDGRGQ